LAKIDTTTQTVTEVSLGNQCLDPVGAITDSANIYVVCAGAVQYDSNFNAIGDSEAGVVMLSTPAGAPEQVLATWTIACPATTGDAGCPVVEPFNIAKVGSRIYVGDANGGRVFAADVVGNTLVERRGYAPVNGGPPVQACPFVSGVSFTDVGGMIAP
jgi:hypothetical protein